MKVGDLLNSRSWIEAPQFLLVSEKDWPIHITEDIVAEDDLELKRDAVVNTIINQDSPSPADQLLLYFSDWRRLKVP